MNTPAIVVLVATIVCVLAYVFFVIRSTRYTAVPVILFGAGAAFLTVVFGTVMLPYLTDQQPKASPGQLRPYNRAELLGRSIYMREGCYYCHSQFTRVQDRDLGPPSQATDYDYDDPHLLGTERTGPDLSNVGGRFPDEWHRAHHRNPRAMFPGSLMPAFAFLDSEKVVLEKEIPQSELPANYRSRQNESGHWILEINDPMARVTQEGWRQATNMDVLITYVQSLGTRKPPTQRETEVPKEYKFVFDDKEQKYVERKAPSSIPYELRFIKQGQGIFMEKCRYCHGRTGRGDGPAGRDLNVPPANLTLPRFRSYSEAKWFWRISEGVPGTRMPRWRLTLNEEQRWYLVRWLQYVSGSNPPGTVRTPKPEGVTRPPDTTVPRTGDITNVPDSGPPDYGPTINAPGPGGSPQTGAGANVPGPTETAAPTQGQ